MKPDRIADERDNENEKFHRLEWRALEKASDANAGNSKTTPHQLDRRGEMMTMMLEFVAPIPV